MQRRNLLLLLPASLLPGCAGITDDDTPSDSDGPQPVIGIERITVVNFRDSPVSGELRVSGGDSPLFRTAFELEPSQGKSYDVAVESEQDVTVDLSASSETESRTFTRSGISVVDCVLDQDGMSIYSTTTPGGTES
jgi:hypothetical protein